MAWRVRAAVLKGPGVSRIGAAVLIRGSSQNNRMKLWRLNCSLACHQSNCLLLCELSVRPIAMNLFQLRAFDAVTREGSFTRAAERLFISQPAVTGHIKALEEHYQIVLLRRTARRVELNEEGTKLAAITRAICGLVEEAQTRMEAN